ncbi:uncharacterized protein [Lepisosteus oculatus]|uniref:uncharacterized protein isoform X1 n=2 Tax=Lepisosteus oculatus TaxID=7918 RepID=UPI00372496BA
MCSLSLCESEKASLEYESLRQLDALCERAVESSCCPRRPDGDYSGVSQEMMHFIKDTYHMVTSEMEQMLALEEKKQKEAPKFNSIESPSAWASMARRRPHSVESEDLHLATRRGSVFQLKPKAEPGEIPAPPLHCAESQVLGRSVAAVLASDPGRMGTVCKRLKGQLLPESLRGAIWIGQLLKPEAFSDADTFWTFEKTLREKFGRMVERRVAELKLRSATRSPISGLIENAVVEKYERTPSMQAFATNEQMISESSKVLNILYVHSGIYEPYLIHWLFPLQMAFRQTDSKAEHLYELSMYLHCLIQKFPCWPEIFAMAENVMRHVEENDPELFAHLQLCSSRNMVLDSKDFLVELIAQEREKAQELLDFSDRSDRPQVISKKLLANPVIFLRKWMGEGFMSVLDLPAVLLVWDQLFMENWSRKVMEDVCLVVLMLLKDPLMAADDYQSMREVLLDHASHLFTADIQRSWMHLQQGGLPVDIPELNRFNSRLLYGPFPKKTAANAQISMGDILPIGLKDVVVNLILNLPKTDSLNHAWMKDFDPLAVKLITSVLYGNVKLHSKSSLLTPSVEKRAPNKETTTEYKLLFNDIFIFDALDPSDIREISYLKDKPAVVIKVIYVPNLYGSAPVTLGWVKADLFHEEKSGPQTQWTPSVFTAHLKLCTGADPELLTNHTSTHNLEEPLQKGSNIQVTVFDPSKESPRRGASHAELQSTTLPPEEPRFLYPPWVTHNASLAVPHQSSVYQPLDLYIDSVQYIPDNATIVKVTGRILQSGQEDLPDISALPDLSSPARSPEFNFRMTVNPSNKKPFDRHMLLLLRVYTVSSDTGELCVIGNCIIRVFNDQEQLNVGGHQLRLHGGMPPKDQIPLTEASLSHQPVIPCCTLLIRILPHMPDLKPTPSYLSGFYLTDRAKPNKSELGIIATFQRNRDFPKTVKEMMQQLENKEHANVPPELWLAWYEERLDARKQLPPQNPPAHLSIHHMVRYHQQAGIRIRITQAFGLPAGGLYVNAFARILKGAESLHLAELPQGWGGEEKFVTLRRDFTSLQRCPRWTDQSAVLHPYHDPHTVLLVQLFALHAVYRADPSGQRCGTVSALSGEHLKLDSKSQLGWAVVPLFEGPYVWSGIHHVPIFQGNPDGGFLGAVISLPLKDAISRSLKNKKLKLQKNYGSVVAEVWDGHYFDDERHDLPVIDNLLTVHSKKKFLKTQSKKPGKEISQLVLQRLNRKIRKQGCSSEEYQREEQFYEEAMGNTFYALMVRPGICSGLDEGKRLRKAFQRISSVTNEARLKVSNPGSKLQVDNLRQTRRGDCFINAACWAEK